MEPAPSPRRIARFGVFELDLNTAELRKHGHKIRIHGQPIQILTLLTARAGELVTREELHQKLWPSDTYVDFEQGLNAAVKRLRQALNDSADNPRFVETLPRRGYRFIAPIETIGGSQKPTDAGIVSVQEPVGENALSDIPKTIIERGHLRSRLSWTGVALVSVLALAFLAIWIFRPATPARGIQSLAVLPLENLSHDASQEYFSDGMTDELITELGQINGLRVISRTSMMSYKDTRKSVRQIAKELNVDAVVEGTVLRSGGQVRITAQLIEAVTDKQVWSRSYEGELRDTLTLQNGVARAIATQIQTKLNPQEDAGLRSARAVDPEAYEAYLKGRYFWNKRTGDGLTKAIRYFKTAIDKDPNYAQAFAGLADSYALAGDWQYGLLAPREAYPKAKAAATKALELDGTLGEAHISLALCLDGFDWDWDTAGREFIRGIELSPGYATGHHWYGWYLAHLGRNDEAISEMKKAESLDPLSLIIGADLAEELLIARRYDEAIRQARKTLNLDPLFALAHRILGQIFVQQHRYNEGIAELQKAIELSPGGSASLSNLAYAYAVSGRRDEALKMLNDLKNRSSDAFSNAPELAMVYVGLDDKDQAMSSLEKAYSERFNPGVLIRPCFDALRPDPRFQDLLHRVGMKQ
jgi:TolB-like protein/DNA-binding winged helix-turn-helix (wHTH) protein/Tfp pilus assembly protein PilF